jgi:hypothetical protein
MDKIGGIAVAEFAGTKLAFPTDRGYGLVTVAGKTLLFKYKCHLESNPPQGTAELVLSTGPTPIKLELKDGVLTYMGHTVTLGEVYKS